MIAGTNFGFVIEQLESYGHCLPLVSVFSKADSLAQLLHGVRFSVRRGALRCTCAGNAVPKETSIVKSKAARQTNSTTCPGFFSHDFREVDCSPIS